MFSHICVCFPCPFMGLNNVLWGKTIFAVWVELKEAGGDAGNSTDKDTAGDVVCVKWGKASEGMVQWAFACPCFQGGSYEM